MTCEEAAAELARLHDGLLDAERERAVREHVAVCVACREMDAAIAFSRELLSHLSPVEMREADRAAARAALEKAAARRRNPWVIAVAAAALVVVAGAVWLTRPRVRFVAPPAEVRSIERVATTAEDAWRRGRGSVEERTSSIDRVREIVRDRTEVETRLRPVARSNRRVIGVSSSAAGSARVVTVVFDIGGQPVTLAVARSAALADGPPSLLFAKRLEVRHGRDMRVFTWSAGGDAYSLAVPRGVAVADACAICHGVDK